MEIAGWHLRCPRSLRRHLGLTRVARPAPRSGTWSALKMDRSNSGLDWSPNPSSRLVGLVEVDACTLRAAKPHPERSPAGTSHRVRHPTAPVEVWHVEGEPVVEDHPIRTPLRIELWFRRGPGQRAERKYLIRWSGCLGRRMHHRMPPFATRSVGPRGGRGVGFLIGWPSPRPAIRGGARRELRDLMSTGPDVIPSAVFTERGELRALVRGRDPGADRAVACGGSVEEGCRRAGRGVAARITQH